MTFIPECVAKVAMGHISAHLDSTAAVLLNMELVSSMMMFGHLNLVTMDSTISIILLNLF